MTKVRDRDRGEKSIETLRHDQTLTSKQLFLASSDLKICTEFETLAGTIQRTISDPDSIRIGTSKKEKLKNGK